jgi:hypothetical protein
MRFFFQTLLPVDAHTESRDRKVMEQPEAPGPAFAVAQNFADPNVGSNADRARA